MDVQSVGMDLVLTTGQDRFLSPIPDSVVPSSLVVGLLNSVFPNEKVVAL